MFTRSGPFSLVLLNLLPFAQIGHCYLILKTGSVPPFKSTFTVKKAYAPDLYWIGVAGNVVAAVAFFALAGWLDWFALEKLGWIGHAP